MHINLYATALIVKLLRYGFNSSLGLNLNFEIEFAHKLVVNLIVDFQKTINLNLNLKMGKNGWFQPWI